MSTERDELAPMRDLDAHRPTHREYTGGWWELACTGCDFAEGMRLSHLDWVPHHAHREEIFRVALLAAGYRKTSTVTTVEELDALSAKSAILDQTGTPWVGDGDKVEPWASVCEDPYGGPIWKNSIDIPLPATVLHEPEASK